MGKYMRTKSNSNSTSTNNNSTEISLNFMEISNSLGVRTRAKTLALKSQITNLPSSSSSSLGYLQLRNRRLLRRLKPPSRKPYFDHRRITNTGIGNPNLCNSSSVAGSKNDSRVRVTVDSPNCDDKLGDENGDGFDDNCCGENAMESDYKERSTRECTPRNMIQDPDAVHTPGSTTRPVRSAQATRRLRSSTQRDIPTSHEMEEFFADAEEQQQNEFIHKYNFDPVNDKPLLGRYEWEQVKP